MTKKVLITGGNGFIGSHILRVLVKNDYSPVLYIRKTSDLWRITDLLDKITIYNDTTPLENLFREGGFETVINLATYYKKVHGSEDIRPMIETNVTFPAQILELCQRYQIGRFITAGSYFQYSNFLENGDGYKLIPRNLYASTKSALDKIMEYYNSNGLVTALNLVLFTPYGPMDHPEKLIPYIISNGIKKNPISLSYGLQMINPVYVDDVAEAFLNAMRVKMVQNSDNIHINIANKRSFSIRETVSIIEELLGYAINKQWGSFETVRFDCDNSLNTDTSDAETRLRWRPRTDIYKGILQTIEYYASDKHEG